VGYLLSEPLMFGFYGVLVPAALLLAIKRPELFALLPVALCAAANSRTGLFGGGSATGAIRHPRTVDRRPGASVRFGSVLGTVAIQGPASRWSYCSTPATWWRCWVFATCCRARLCLDSWHPQGKNASVEKIGGLP
jgi:hypothetical protein